MGGALVTLACVLLTNLHHNVDILAKPERLAKYIKDNYLCGLPSDVRCGHTDDFFRVFERAGIHLLPVHFYSIVPEVSTLNISKFQRPELSASTLQLCSLDPESCPILPLAGVDMNIKGQVEGLEACTALREEFEAISSKPLLNSIGQPVFHSRWVCSQHTPAGQPCTPYGAIDAQVYHCFVRGATKWQAGVKPKKVIEIGSGHSTYVAGGAMEANAEDGLGGSLMSIEPYPAAELVEVFKEKKFSFQLLQQKLQDVDLEVFRALNAGDILFIDSTHVAVPGSDVVYEFTKILPELKVGVIVHVHDICLPFETAWDWTFKDYRFWNEQYLLQTFLINNNDWEVFYMGILWQHYFPSFLRKIFPLEGSNGSFWMRRRVKTK
jgi:hypothetical protein